MIRVDVEQGTQAWLGARLGIPTASSFDKIITNKTMKLSASADAYAYHLAAERILGFPIEEERESSGYAFRGTTLERSAVDFYELQRGVDTEKVGFVLRDDRRAGCSPDRLVGNDGLLEIKCPSPGNHIAYLLGGEKVGLTYRAQTQGQLWICEREWVDVESYHPDFASTIVRFTRDDAYIAALAAAVEQFTDFVDETMLKLARMGHVPESVFQQFPARQLRVA